MRHAVYAGSFDPITNGHLWMIDRGSRLVDRLTVAIGINPDKRYRFTLESRLEMLRESVAGLPNVVVAHFENLFLVHYARQIDATMILRGIRNEQDYSYERGMRYVNGEFDDNIVSVFLMPPREYAEISSSFVKGLVGPEGWEDVLRKYVPPSVYSRFVVRPSRLAELIPTWPAIEVELRHRYAESSRHYHNQKHIDALLSQFATCSERFDDPVAAELAIWFHDAVYEARRSDNEEASARMAVDRLSQAGVDATRCNRVAEMIAATRHAAAPSTDDARLLVDLDLSVLAADPAVFDAYERAIRKEYAHVGEADFSRGRAEVLQRFLDRPSIFLSNAFASRESAARTNLLRSLSRLAAAPTPA